MPHGQVARRRARRLLTPLVALAGVTATLACSAGGVTPGSGCRPAPGRPPITVPASSPWAASLCHWGNQRPPTMVNGIVHRDGVLWIASFLGGEIVAADAGTGEILGRFGPGAGVGTGPDDLVMADDGTVYWTGMLTGEVGALRPTTRQSRRLANVGIGVNPITRAPDGGLLVGHAYLGTGLARVDPATGAARNLNPGLAVNGFAIGPDGMLYAARTDTIPSQLVRVDPASGRSTTVAADVGLAGVSVKFPPAARGEAATTAYVLQGSPPAVRRVDIRTGERAAPDITLPLTMTDNMAFAPDGTLYVTGNLSPLVAVVGVDGTARTLPIGLR